MAKKTNAHFLLAQPFSHLLQMQHLSFKPLNVHAHNTAFGMSGIKCSIVWLCFDFHCLHPQPKWQMKLGCNICHSFLWLVGTDGSMQWNGVKQLKTIVLITEQSEWWVDFTGFAKNANVKCSQLSKKLMTLFLHLKNHKCKCFLWQWICIQM